MLPRAAENTVASHMRP